MAWRFAEDNGACAQTGYEFGAERTKLSKDRKSSSLCFTLFTVAMKQSLGAVYAGCRFYFWYPMTPSTTIMETLAGFSSEMPLIVNRPKTKSPRSIWSSAHRMPG